MFRRIAAVIGLLVLLGIGAVYLRQTTGKGGDSANSPAFTPASPHRGGSLTATVRAEPRTFNRFASQSFPTHLVSLLTDARLVRVNPATDLPEPWLAERITRTDTTLDVTLRPGLHFSDGTPATAVFHVMS